MTENGVGRKKIRWAIGGANAADIAHAYLSDDDYTNGKALCGRTCYPAIELENWDMSMKLVSTHTCPRCKERLKLLKFMKVDDAD